MNHTIDNPVGIDKPIQDLQNYLYKKLDWSNVEMFGRVYKNEIDGGFVPQHFIKGEDYLKDVYIDDRNNAHVFFISSDEHKKTKDNIRFTNEIKVVFMVNLSKLFPKIKHRADSNVQDYVFNIIKKRHQSDITGIESGLNTVFRGYNTKTIKHADLQPWHTFAILIDLTYQFNINHCKN